MTAEQADVRWKLSRPDAVQGAAEAVRVHVINSPADASPAWRRVWAGCPPSGGDRRACFSLGSGSPARHHGGVDAGQG